ncbi:MAG: 23S rRNA (adenine(2503)-C(2))-methyltransferase RlmN [Chitinivibrionales bacterium]|nr:23S rRNA (adenine(2503)-C(2))-methyltransferase RlmN [Chitinivibrionales bacterium]
MMMSAIILHRPVPQKYSGSIPTTFVSTNCLSATKRCGVFDMQKNVSPRVHAGHHLPEITGISLDVLERKLREFGQSAYRMRQIMNWIYHKHVHAFDDMSNLSKNLRTTLSGNFALGRLEQVACVKAEKGDAAKFGFELRDGAGIIESVLLYDDRRRTACISSQLGCNLGCVFCETGRLGLLRNLTQGEILGQLLAMNEYLEKRGDKSITNVVFMGMGEALANFRHFRNAVDYLMHPDAFNLGGRRITVSTAGVVPSIERLMREKLNVNLAISLNTYSNELRDRLMPINKKYPIEQLIEVSHRYFEHTGRRVTFEYVLIKGENDSDAAAAALKKHLAGLTCKVNVIPLNNCDYSSEKTPAKADVVRFVKKLHSFDIGATIRTTRGNDIFGACGQLGHLLLHKKSAAYQNI